MLQFRGLLGDLLFDQRRAHEARAHDVGRDVELRAFLGQHLGEADQAVLGGDIGCLELGSFLGVHRAHVDDAAVLGGVHVLQAGLGGEEGAVEMDRQQLLPVGEREVDDRLDDLDAGVADQDVDLAVLGHGVGDALLDLGLVGHVHGDGEGIASLGLDLGCGLAGGIEVEVGDHRDAAFGCEAEGDFLADAAGGAGDDGNSSCET